MLLPIENVKCFCGSRELPACYLFDMSFGPNDAETVYKLSQSDTQLGRRVLSALRIIEEALDRYG
jgi:hypothetical protein